MKDRVLRLLLPAVLPGCLCSLAQSADEGPTAPPAGASKPIFLSHVRLDGELGTRYMAATCNLLTRTDRYSLDTFASSASGKPGALWWDWPGDQIGRWLSVLHVAEDLGWTQAAWHRRAIAEVSLPHQTKEGNFGPPGSAGSKDSRIPSGNAFALRGLMDAYADTRDPRYLEAARKLGRYFEKIAPAWETGRKGTLHEFYGHCLDGLVALYKEGGDRWALDLAERLARHAGRTPHTHHSLSLCRGLVDLTMATGKPEPLETVEDYLGWCRRQQTVTGGLPENLPTHGQDEGCALADWIVVNLMMFQATGRDRYLDNAEHTLVNHFLMNQFHTGGFGHRTFSQEIVGGKDWQGWDGRFGSENPGCCSLWGQWALGQVGRFIVTESGDTVWVNLYPAAAVRLPQRGMRLEITGDFPRMSKARIRVECEKPQSASLALRVPSWTRAMNVSCDGARVDAPPKGNRVLLSRTWNAATIVDIEFVAGPRTVPWPADEPKGVAVFDGPICLSLSSKTADVALPWTVRLDASGQPILDEQGRPQVTATSGKASALEPIGEGWLTPDVKDPARKRVLFRAEKAG